MRFFVKSMLNVCVVLIATFCTVTGSLALAKAEKVAWPHFPSVRFSDVWMGDSIGRIRGQYDVTLLIPDLPAGSDVYMHFAQDVETTSGHGRMVESWVSPSVIPMKRWEEFGLFANPQVMLRSRVDARRVVGIRFYFEFRLPNGDVRYSGGGTSPGPHYLASNPDMNVCHDVGADGLKVCAIVIQPQSF